MKKNYKKAHGVTLISLVVTIIVVYILGCVSIWALTREKNILNQTLEAKEQMNIKATEYEILQTWYSVQNDTKNEYYDNTTLTSLFKEKLANKDARVMAVYNEQNNCIEVYFKEYLWWLNLATGDVVKI